MAVKKIPTECKVKKRNPRNPGGKIKYAYYFEGVSVNGKRHQVEIGGFCSYEEAKREGDKALIEYYRPSSIIVDNQKLPLISVSDFIYNIWLPAQAKRKNWLVSTVKSYEKQIKNHIIPEIGELPISSVSFETLQKIVNDMYYSQKYSHSSVSNLHSLIHSIWTYAEKHDYIRRFYSDEFIVPVKDERMEQEYSIHKQRRDIIPEEILDKIFARFPERTTAFLILAICLYTGARLGEAAALTVEACDFEKNIIHITRQIADGNDNMTCHPKYNSVRYVPMCPTLKGILIRAIERNRKNEQDWGCNYKHTFLNPIPDSENFRNLHDICEIRYDDIGEEVHFINVNEYGKVCGPSVMKHAARIIHGYNSDHKNKEKKKPIFEFYNNHSLRHTFSSSLDEQEVNDTVISAVMGHKKKMSRDASVTSGRYIHTNMKQIQDLCEIADDIYHFKDGVLKK